MAGVSNSLDLDGAETDLKFCLDYYHDDYKGLNHVFSRDLFLYMKDSTAQQSLPEQHAQWIKKLTLATACALISVLTKGKRVLVTTLPDIYNHVSQQYINTIIQNAVGKYLTRWGSFYSGDLIQLSDEAADIADAAVSRGVVHADSFKTMDSWELKDVSTAFKPTEQLKGANFSKYDYVVVFDAFAETGNKMKAASAICKSFSRNTSDVKFVPCVVAALCTLDSKVEHKSHRLNPRLKAVSFADLLDMPIPEHDNPILQNKLQEYVLSETLKERTPPPPPSPRRTPTAFQGSRRDSPVVVSSLSPSSSTSAARGSPGAVQAIPLTIYTVGYCHSEGTGGGGDILSTNITSAMNQSEGSVIKAEQYHYFQEQCKRFANNINAVVKKNGVVLLVVAPDISYSSRANLNKLMLQVKPHINPEISVEIASPFEWNNERTDLVGRQTMEQLETAEEVESLLTLQVAWRNNLSAYDYIIFADFVVSSGLKFRTMRAMIVPYYNKKKQQIMMFSFGVACPLRYDSAHAHESTFGINAQFPYTDYDGVDTFLPPYARPPVTPDRTNPIDRIATGAGVLLSGSGIDFKNTGLTPRLSTPTTASSLPSSRLLSPSFLLDSARLPSPSISEGKEPVSTDESPVKNFEIEVPRKAAGSTKELFRVIPAYTRFASAHNYSFVFDKVNQTLLFAEEDRSNPFKYEFLTDVAPVTEENKGFNGIRVRSAAARGVSSLVDHNIHSVVDVAMIGDMFICLLCWVYRRDNPGRKFFVWLKLSIYEFGWDNFKPTVSSKCGLMSLLGLTPEKIKGLLVLGTRIVVLIDGSSTIVRDDSVREFKERKVADVREISRTEEPIFYHDAVFPTKSATIKFSYVCLPLGWGIFETYFHLEKFMQGTPIQYEQVGGSTTAGAGAT